MYQSLVSLVECPICLEPFQDPRMLNCLHTLCHDCLDTHMIRNGQDGQFGCPICRTSLQIPKEGASCFPKNSCIARASDDRRHVRRPNLCSNSEDGDACTDTVEFCLECCEYYCKACSKAHRRSKASRGHQLIALEYLTDEMLNNARSDSETPKCQKHKDEKLKLFCRTCDSAVCALCCHISHQHHNFQDITDIDEDLKTGLGKAVTTLQHLLDETEESTTKISRSKTGLERSTSKARKTTERAFQKMHQMLDQKTNQIDQEIRKAEEDGRAKADLQERNLATRTELLQNLLSVVLNLLHSGSVFNRLVGSSEVRSLMQEISEYISGEGVTGLEVPSSADLIAGHVDDVVLEEDVQFDSNVAGEHRRFRIIQKWCITPDIFKRNVGVQTGTPLPKLVIVMYATNSSGLVERTVSSLTEELECEVFKPDGTHLGNLATELPQVDVIDVVFDVQKYSFRKYKFRKSYEENRNLVLLQHTRDGSLGQTCRALGASAHLFKRFIQFDSAETNSLAAARDSLADYFLRVSRD